jgi:hypothetical protein
MPSKLFKNPLRLIGVILVVMATISGFGLYQTMVNWALVQETRMNFDVDIVQDSVILDFTDGGHAVLTVTFRFDNVDSELDVQVKEISFYTYASKDDYMPQASYVGLGSRAFIDSPELGVVEKGSGLDISASVGIQNDTVYMDILQGSDVDGAYPIQVQAIIRYEIADFPKITDKLFEFWMGDVVEA